LQGTINAAVVGRQGLRTQQCHPVCPLGRVASVDVSVAGVVQLLQVSHRRRVRRQPALLLISQGTPLGMERVSPELTAVATSRPELALEACTPVGPCNGQEWLRCRGALAHRVSRTAAAAAAAAAAPPVAPDPPPRIPHLMMLPTDHRHLLRVRML